ncbi:hypothetical protein [Actinoplanes regularis]|uniref:hypothetical protein n=1 Tax=Actinoplanes regularis TaxID=52697 RepID=UPI0024A3CB10|nr:hypothetical protein [Actinoplanes regularis]GLW30624.1 hypothetical protein Areg01_35640 [Actinoplanes regularis]
MSLEPPRILDASALVQLFHGHPDLMKILKDSDLGQFSVAAPAGAVLEAQVVLKATTSMWDHFLAHRVFELPLSGHASVEAGDLARSRLENHPVHRVLTGPPMVGQVLREAFAMNGAIVTAIPENYGGHNVVLAILD